MQNGHSTHAHKPSKQRFLPPGIRTVAHDLRLKNLQILLRLAGNNIQQLSNTLQIIPGRLGDLLEGIAPITDELAVHVKESLGIIGYGLDEKFAFEQKLSEAMRDALAGGKEVKNETADDIQELPETTKVTVETIHGAAETDQTAKMQNIDESDKIGDLRRLNLKRLTNERGYKNRLSNILNEPDNYVSTLLLKRRKFTDKLARRIEAAIDLSAGWLDVEHADSDVPQIQKFTSDEKAAPSSTRTRTAKKAPATVKNTVTDIPVTTKKDTADSRHDHGGPVAEALRKTLDEKITNGQLSEAEAYEMLGMLLDMKRTGKGNA